MTINTVLVPKGVVWAVILSLLLGFPTMIATGSWYMSGREREAKYLAERVETLQVEIRGQLAAQQTEIKVQWAAQQADAKAQWAAQQALQDRTNKTVGDYDREFQHIKDQLEYLGALYSGGKK